MILTLAGCAQMTIYPQPTKEFIPKPYYQVSYDDAWDTVLQVLGEERVGTTYQSQKKGQMITGFFTQAKEGANVQKRARWSYTITFTQLDDNRTNIDIVCKIEQYLKGWGFVAYEWRDITDVSGYKNIAHSLEKWLYEKIEKKIKNGFTSREGVSDNLIIQEKQSIDANPLYKGIKGVVLQNGDVILGQIISIDNDVLKIRTKEGKVFSYSFMKEVKKYIRE
jgi:hypothetical protein